MRGERYSDTAATPGPMRARLVIALVLMAFIGGLASMAWIMTHWDGGLNINQAVTGEPLADNGAASPGPAASPSPAATPAALPSTAAGAPAAAAGAAAPAGSLDTRMVDLEQRLTRVSVSAQAASGYANRAEAMMVAFAARRTLDAGAPLGYLEGQLRLLFGEAQPKAVATIINAASEPVTVNKLRAGLEDIRLQLDRAQADRGWWSAFVSGLGSLVEIRQAGTPTPEPEQRLARARRAVEAGQIEDAIAEAAALPPQPAIAQWLEQARRYNEAHRALDVIEAAAILEPRAAPLVAPTAQPAEAPAK